ncbi:MAG: sigma-70 family RNA polymerase sigma factor [Dehalococcoidia bacterium]|nr:sigma-70 family RNA polymerase sigma factor [Dehalococcoidia bacterium]
MNSTDIAALAEDVLVSKAQKGDQACLAALYERYYDRVYRFALTRLGSRSDSEDLAQGVFLKMVDKLPSYRLKGLPFAAWLFRIAHNAVVDQLRRRSRRPQVGMDEIDMASNASTELEVERSLTNEELVKAIRGLTPAQQDVITLRFASGLSVSETAKTLGKAEGTVKATQSQALRALRRVIAR